MPASKQQRKSNDQYSRHDSARDREYDRGRRNTITTNNSNNRRPPYHHRRSSYDDYSRRGRRARGSSRYDTYLDSDDSSYYASRSPSPSLSPSPPPPRRRHTRSEGQSRRRARSISSSSSSSRDRSREDFARKKRDQAIKSALTAGAVEAFRQRNRSGDWLGERGLRVATAAMSAAAIDTAVDKNPRRKGKRNVIGSTIGGLLVDKLASGIRGRR